jgi:NADH-quinone oxidoreductase subunit F
VKQTQQEAVTFDEIKRQAKEHWHEIQGAKAVVMVGAATCGRAAGALEVLRALRDELKKQDLDCPVFEVGCMGHCYAEPIVVISKPPHPPIVYRQVNPVIARRLVREFIIGDDPCLEFVLGAMGKDELVPDFADFPRAKFEQKVILKDCGFIDPEDIEHYIAHGGYSALYKTLKMSPEAVINEVRKSGLRGRGGAGFAAGEKWAICRNAPGKTKYLVCNGDEGDPGAFMDRAILESDPHSVIEGMVIAAYAVGAKEGYIYVRAEYPLAVKRVRLALRQAKKLNLLGRNILGSGFSFDMQLFQGSGAFVCGEESALIASLEGEAGTPPPPPPQNPPTPQFIEKIL